ncbi:hypothetical protein ZYGR_0N02270 [Zygosaccharomyces rouxii]|uniref:Uncharacterized protein n=1 Tax=Zygosaccharomyces rouxii TaxID=4956 RepID=A0A1Q2ZZH6_ZYGRO|nr:hypothetical protein ZYGR_0N02270 [Zygosaccharomyces rouxii]
MATANGMNGISHPPVATTLDELLKDDKFGFEESPVSNRNYNEGQLYQLCLASFIRGDSKDCLEKMYEFGFLESQILAENDQVYALFQGACDAIKNFNSLGTNLQKVIRATFTGDTNHLENHIAGKPRSFEIAILNRYYRCCAKVLQMDSAVNGPQISYLETKVRNDIDKHSSVPLFQDPESIVELEQLAETYIFHILVGLMHKQVSSYLYKRLCESASGLSDNLNNIIGNGKTVEQRILERLESKERKSKKSRSITSSSRPHGDTTTTEKKLPSPESPKQVQQFQEHDQQQGQGQGQEQQLQAAPKWLHICYRYINRFKFSRQTLVIALLLLLLSARKIRGISRIPNYIAQTTRAAAPHLRNLLRLLSSI